VAGGAVDTIAVVEAFAADAVAGSGVRGGDGSFSGLDDPLPNPQDLINDHLFFGASLFLVDRFNDPFSSASSSSERPEIEEEERERVAFVVTSVGSTVGVAFSENITEFACVPSSFLRMIKRRPGAGRHG